MCEGQKSNPPPANSSSGAEAQPSTSKSSTSGATFTTTSDGESDVILPSFTASIENSSGRIVKTRAWKDECSQDTLIEQSLADELGLTKIKDLNFTIRGVNAERTFRTSCVRVPVWIKDKKVSITATCVPSIDITLNLPNIDPIINSFKSKGYELADSQLGSDSSALTARLLLGSDNAGLLSIQSQSFGGGNDRLGSVFLQTPLGVMLQGSVANYGRDCACFESVSRSE